MKLVTAVGPGTGSVSVGQLNVWNFFDTKNDPLTWDTVYTPEQYAVRVDKLSLLITGDMNAPDVVALQEFENEQTLRDLLGAPAMARLGYRYVMGEHADARGIRNAIIYRANRLTLETVQQPNPVTDLPPEDPSGPTADKLFARAPIMATFVRTGADGARDGARFTMIANHFKSKIGGEFFEPRRRAQGTFVGGLVDAARAAQPSVPVVVLGDLNATPADGAYANLIARPDGTSRLQDTLDRLPEADRYSYIYRGHKNLLDHLMVTPDLADAVTGVQILHLNSGTKDADRFVPGTSHGTSDHDPLLATIRLG